MTTCIDEGKVSNISISLYDNSYEGTRNRRKKNFYIIKAIYSKSVTNMTVSMGKLKTFSLKWKMRQEFLLSPVLYCYSLNYENLNENINSMGEGVKGERRYEQQEAKYPYFR